MRWCTKCGSRLLSLRVLAFICLVVTKNVESNNLTVNNSSVQDTSTATQEGANVTVTVSSPASTTATHLYHNVSSSSSLDLADSPSTEQNRCIQRDSAGLNNCLHQLLNDLRPRLGRGIPEINLPPIEPLRLENVAFDQGSGAVRIASHFTNVEVTGLSNFSQFDFWVDVTKKTMDFDLIFPQLSLVGMYELSGNLFFIPIGGSGNFFLNLGGTRAKGVSDLSVFRNNTASQVVVKKTDVNLEIDTIKVHLANLFNGDPVLGTFINNFLNENSQEVFDEVKPQIGAQVGEILSLLANRALSALSTSQFDEEPFSSSLSKEDNNQQSNHET